METDTVELKIKILSVESKLQNAKWIYKKNKKNEQNNGHWYALYALLDKYDVLHRCKSVPVISNCQSQCICCFYSIIFHHNILVTIEWVFQTISTGLFGKIEIKNRNDLGELLLIRNVYFSTTLTANANWIKWFQCRFAHQTYRCSLFIYPKETIYAFNFNSQTAICNQFFFPFWS